MGIARFYFARGPKGGLKRIKISAYDAFHFRDGSLPVELADDHGKINVAEIVAETEDRSLVRLLDVHFVRYGLLKDGRYDPADQEVHMLDAARRMAEGSARDRGEAPLGLLDAASRFAGRRFEAATRWSPTDAERTVMRTFLTRRMALGASKRDEREDAISRRSRDDRVTLATEANLDWQLRILGRDADAAVRAAVAAKVEPLRRHAGFLCREGGGPFVHLVHRRRAYT